MGIIHSPHFLYLFSTLMCVYSVSNFSPSASLLDSSISTPVGLVRVSTLWPLSVSLAWVEIVSNTVSLYCLEKKANLVLYIPFWRNILLCIPDRLEDERIFCYIDWLEGEKE